MSNTNKGSANNNQKYGRGKGKGKPKYDNKTQPSTRAQSDSRFTTQKGGYDNRKMYDNDITREHTCNDLDWYVHSAEEALQIGSIPFSEAVGIGYPVNGYEYNVSGLAVAKVAPVYGYSDSALAPINIANRLVYAQNRKVNSGAANYTATAYSFYCFAFDSIYYLINHIKRGLATFNTYSTYNKYTPKTLLAAMGFTWESMASNYPGHVARLNNIIRRAAVFNIPDAFPIFKRHAFMFSGAILDSRSKQSQLYMYVPSVYYEYQDVSTETEGSRLIAHRIDYNIDTEVPRTMDYWFNILDNLLDKAYSSETFQIMNGDTAKAFGDNVYKLSLFNGDETLAVIDDEMVKTQFMNATLVGEPSNLDVVERLDDINSDFYLVHQPKIPNYRLVDEMLGPTQFRDHILNMYMEPNPAVNIEASRLMVPLKFDPAVSSAGFIPADGQHSELVETVTYYITNAPTSTWDTKVQRFIQTFEYGPIPSMQREVAEFIRIWAQFDYAPSFVFCFAEGTDILSWQPVIKNENWTVLPEANLVAMNNIAIQKLFGF